MFGESESESPRVPSPWDSLISLPSPPMQGQSHRTHTPSPLAAELIPRLVPEADDGNVEYKLQLLAPSPARFARLVTQMKWRLLEGGGQAYYELGVADSGDLIGLPREELERSLETLEMMAGEIGASVIVVKEIEVPAALASLAKRSGEWAGAASRRARRQSNSLYLDGGDTTTDPGTTETETETDSCSGTDLDLSTEDTEDLSATVVLEKNANSSRRPSHSDSSSSLIPMFPMDSDQDFDPADAADDERLPIQNRFSIDLEIFSVFKPRPVRTRIHNNPHYAHLSGGKNKKTKKYKHLSMLSSNNTYVTNEQDDRHSQCHAPEHSSSNHKGHNRRQGRDKRREEKRKTLEVHATQVVDAANDDDLSRQDTLMPTSSTITTTLDADVLILGLESLHVGVVEEPEPLTNENKASGLAPMGNIDEFDDDNDVFATPMTAIPSFPTFSASDTAESHLDAAVIGIVGAMGAISGGEKEQQQSRLIVEALVVRKMSMEEAFLDFGGFSLT
ncbi:hypothetical protein BYT27DRAFT_7231739 [Phlegmacium glaucopus]|nr:hypothetical protein BYT27DRAFT_7231739 [Phlegmacium glaucopus]